MVGGEEDNEVIVNHIWSNLGGDNNEVEDVVDPVRNVPQTIPHLHPSWLSDEEQESRAQQSITAEVTRRMNLERQNARPTSIQDELVASTVPYTYDESEEDSQDTTNAPK